MWVSMNEMKERFFPSSLICSLKLSSKGGGEAGEGGAERS